METEEDKVEEVVVVEEQKEDIAEEPVEEVESFNAEEPVQYSAF